MLMLMSEEVDVDDIIQGLKYLYGNKPCLGLTYIYH